MTMMQKLRLTWAMAHDWAQDHRRVMHGMIAVVATLIVLVAFF